MATLQQVFICEDKDESAVRVFRESDKDIAFAGHDDGRWRCVGTRMKLTPKQKNIFCLLRHFPKTGGLMRHDYFSTKAEVKEAQASLNKYHSQWGHWWEEVPIA